MIKRIISEHWKTLLPVAIAITSIVVTIYLWRLNQGEKSLSMTVLSQVSLQPSEKTSIQGLKVLIDDTLLDKPFISVIQLSNDGNKPIVTSDFEAPLEIKSQQAEISIARASVIKKVPEDINPEISWDKQAVRIKPLLLNPQDKITLSVLTSGGQPQFSPKSRIVGVSSVPLVDATKPLPNPLKKWVFLVLALMFAITTMTMWRTKGKALVLRKRTSTYNGIITGFTALFMLTMSLDPQGTLPFWQSYLSIIALFFVGGIIASILNRPIPDAAEKSAPAASSTK